MSDPNVSALVLKAKYDSDEDVRLSAGLELVRLVTERGEYVVLINISKDEGMHSSVRDTAKENILRVASILCTSEDLEPLHQVASENGIGIIQLHAGFLLIDAYSSPVSEEGLRRLLFDDAYLDEVRCSAGRHLLLITLFLLCHLSFMSL